MNSSGNGRNGHMRRRSILKGGLAVAGAASGIAVPDAVGAPPAFAGPEGNPATAAVPRPTPPVVRSREDLTRKGVRFPEPPLAATALPITPNGTTYEMAQTLSWLDSEHFAVGRWDGSMTIFRFTASDVAGPLISEAVNSPAFQGVRMLTPLGNRAIVTSNDEGSIVLWVSPTGRWSDLRPARTHAYDRALGVATGGRGVSAGSPGSLVVGHSTGHLSVWTYHPGRQRLTFLRSVDIRNPAPVNPWGLHDVYSVETATDSATLARVVTGSEDGYVCVVEIPSGRILSQTVFNPRAQRGINHLSVRGDSLLVANCSVGPDDHNLWYYAIDTTSWQITLRDRANLIVDPHRPQAFNFSTIWGAYSGGPCWFASTEEGALWMGTAGTGLDVIGYRAVTSPLGSALGWNDSPGRLVMVAYDLYEFTT
ncbi:hypothetical protein GCM10017673_09150 [Streptosporangium violaceochromogenes]|nr:hypothetical protein GCM10017673_09150 [Streptosporangium violaceochromogenes]